MSRNENKFLAQEVKRCRAPGRYQSEQIQTKVKPMLQTSKQVKERVQVQILSATLWASLKVYAKRTGSRYSDDAVARYVKAKSWVSYTRVSRAQCEDAVWLFLRPKMVRVRLLSRNFFAESSFLADRPDRTERESEVLVLSSLYLSL